jgi:hypothetical protein
MTNQQGKGGSPPTDDRTILDPLNADELRALREAKEKFQRAQSERPTVAGRGVGPDAGDDIGDAPTRALGALPTFDKPGPSLASLQSNQQAPAARIIADPKPLTPESARITTGTVGTPRPMPGTAPLPGGGAPGGSAAQTPGFGENTLMWMQPVRVEQPQVQAAQPGQHPSMPTIVPTEPQSKRTVRAALGVVVVGVIALLAYFLMSSGPKRSVVEIISVPDKADVELDGKSMQYKTNIKATLDPGSHRIVLKKEGYKDESFTLEISEAGQPEGAGPIRKQIELTPISKPGLMTVSIEVGPVAANIRINDKAFSSKRAVKVADIDPNQVNKIVVEAGGYAKMETEIPAGQLKDTYNFLLQAEAKPN